MLLSVEHDPFHLPSQHRFQGEGETLPHRHSILIDEEQVLMDRFDMHQTRRLVPLPEIVNQIHEHGKCISMVEHIPKTISSSLHQHYSLMYIPRPQSFDLVLIV